MNRLNKVLLTALSAVYVILSILPIQQCSLTSELFIYDCPQSSVVESSVQTEERACCKTTPCCGKFIKSSAIEHSFTFQEDILKKIHTPLDFVQSVEQIVLYKSLYTWPKPLESAYVPPNRYILYESFLC